MKRSLLIFFLLFVSAKIFAQQFSLYNTGTLYDAFENPSQHAFTPDTSKMYAFNFFIPNFNTTFFLSGDAQATLKSRAFLNKYNNSALVIDQTRYNHVSENANIYFLMFRTFTNLNGNVEQGISWQLKSDGKGLLTDATIAAFNGTQSFNAGQAYSNVFNSRYYYQTYHQISYTYRQKIDKHYEFGVKLSLLLGVQYQKLNIASSKVVYDKAADSALVALQGRYYAGFIPGRFTTRDYLPNFRSPGASISIGNTYRTEDNFIVQGNIKDLGFIDWSPRSRIYDFDNSASILGLSTPQREDSIYNKVNKIIHNNATQRSFTTPIDGLAELSISKSFFIDDNHQFKYSPTLVASKELFYQGFTAALVNPIQYKKYILTLTPSYNDLKEFNLGAQVMMKTANWEFYFGSDELAQTISLTSEVLNKNSPGVNTNSAYTGFNFFLGFSLKLGPVIEHPMNASSIPTGEKGFLGRLWSRWFKTYN